MLVCLLDESSPHRLTESPLDFDRVGLTVINWQRDLHRLWYCICLSLMRDCSCQKTGVYSSNIVTSFDGLVTGAYTGLRRRRFPIGCSNTRLPVRFRLRRLERF